MFRNFLLQLVTKSDQSLLKCQVSLSQSWNKHFRIYFHEALRHLQKDAVIAEKRWFVIFLCVWWLLIWNNINGFHRLKDCFWLIVNTAGKCVSIFVLQSLFNTITHSQKVPSPWSCHWRPVLQLLTRGSAVAPLVVSKWMLYRRLQI